MKVKKTGTYKFYEVNTDFMGLSKPKLHFLTTSRGGAKDTLHCQNKLKPFNLLVVCLLFSTRKHFNHIPRMPFKDTMFPKVSILSPSL